MPHHFDFSQFETIRELNIDVIGWKSPITIEYAYANDVSDTMLYWRIKGTTHTFVISVSEINMLSKGNTIEHFQQALTVFRDDLVNWSATGLPEKWMREYLYMFKNFIKL